MSLKDNVTIITGASTGIGEELAYQLAQQGAKLVLTARRQEELDRVAEKARGFGGKVTTVSADVGKSGDCKKIIDSRIWPNRHARQQRRHDHVGEVRRH